MALAWAVLTIALLGLIYSLAAFAFVPSSPAPASILERLALPLLALAGLGVAAYLSYVELAKVEAFCGPVGGCNVVQTSRYARLFGVAPLGLVGAAGYAFILAASLAGWIWRKSLLPKARMTIFAAALFGTAFSAYLTCIEIFVLHAACIWCLSSAVLMTLILAISARPAAASP